MRDTREPRQCKRTRFHRHGGVTSLVWAILLSCCLATSGLLLSACDESGGDAQADSTPTYASQSEPSTDSADSKPAADSQATGDQPAASQPKAQETASQEPITYAYTTWNEAESPNYVRHVGDARIAQQLSPGEVRYSQLDSLGRAGQVAACVTKQMMDEGTASERGDLPDPAGWGNNEKVQIELPNGRLYHGWFWNRSHLLAKSLGGDAELHNLVTGTRMQNVGANNDQGGMEMTEAAVRALLRQHPDTTVMYVATPVYEGSELIPRSVFVDVLSSDGIINEEVEVYNAAKGFQIDYSTGSITAVGEDAQVETGGTTSGSGSASSSASGQSAAPTAAPSASEDKGQVVYVTKSGKRYHSTPNCRGLRNAKTVTETTLGDAEARGLTPCKICE